MNIERFSLLLRSPCHRLQLSLTAAEFLFALINANQPVLCWGNLTTSDRLLLRHEFLQRHLPLFQRLLLFGDWGWLFDWTLDWLFRWLVNDFAVFDSNPAIARLVEAGTPSLFVLIMTIG